MTRAMCAVAFVCAIVLSISTANAKPRHQKQTRTASQALQYCASDGTYRQTCGQVQTSTTHHARVSTAYANDAQIVAHPAGCPRRLFCGCGVSVKVFGKPVRDLYLAANWLYRFPRAAPASGMVAARRGHVMYIMAYNGGGSALVYDPNSGGGKTRIHERSLAGYRVVDPNGARVASR